MTSDSAFEGVLRTRALFAIAYAVARYVPIPLLDDWLRERIALSVLRRAAASRGHALDKAALAPLTGTPWGCAGCLLAAVWLPIKLILWPIRTLVAVVLGVRWASRDLLEVLALGRTLDRVIADGRFPMSASIDDQTAFAVRARAAFDAAMRGVDTQAVSGVLALALGPLRKLAPSALRVLRRASREETPESAETSAPASRIVAALDEPKVKALLEAIDQRFDAALASPVTR